MKNIQFETEQGTFFVEYDGGRPDKCRIKGPLANNTQINTFTRLVIDVSKDSNNFIRTTFSIDAIDATGRKLRPEGIYKAEEIYETVQGESQNYDMYISVLGPILMPLLVNNMAEKIGIEKPYSQQKIGQIIAGLQTLASQLDV
jgi:hypothetical protein